MKRRSDKTEETTGAVRPAEAGGDGGLAEQLRPWLLAAATTLWVARPLFPSEAAASHGDGLPVVMLWLVLAVCWLLGMLGSRRFRLRFGWTDAAAGLLVVLTALAALWAVRYESPRPALNMLWEWTGMALGFFLTRQLLGGLVQARAMIAVMIALAAGLSGYGLYQRSVEMPRAEAEYKMDPEATAHEAGVWAPAGSPERQHLQDRLKNREPTATFALTNSLAAMLAPWLVIAVAICASCSPWRKAVPCILAALLIAACLALTRSRSSYVAVAVGLALLGLAWGGKLRLGWKLPAGAALAAAVLVAGLWAAGLPPRPLADRAAKSFDYRLQYWQATLRMIAQRPLGGCGPGNFQDAYTAYKLPEASEEVADPHDFLLEVWVTAGTPAMLALVAMLASFVWALRTVPFTPAPVPTGAESGVANRQGGERPGPVFVGLVAGFALAVPLGQISAAPPSLTATLLGLPLAGGSLLLLAPWVRSGRLGPAWPAIGVAVMLVNLSAASGIALPGVAGSFWLLLALALDGHGRASGTVPFSQLRHENWDSPRQQLGSQGEWMLPRPAAAAMLIAALGLTAACYASGYHPVLRSEAAVRSAEVALWDDRASDVRRDLEEAARSDPLSAEPWRQLAALTFQEWQHHRSEANFRRFDRYMTAALERAPRAAATWLVAGERYFEIFTRSRRPADRKKALDAYARAIQLYPNNALYHAEFALTLRAVGQHDAFRREADTALRLDALNPHVEKRLPPVVRRPLTEEKGSGIRD
jgi:hypothetical protein